MSTELLEREHEIAALAECLMRAGPGRGTLAIIRGHAGVGKSELMAQACRCASSAGFAAAVARGSALEREFPFGVVLQLFEPLIAALPAGDRPAVFHGAASLSEMVFSLQSQETIRGGSLFSLLHGLYWLTANLAERRPLLIAVDDAQWSDDASLRFVLYLLQRLDDLPVAVVVAHRPGEPGSPRELLDQVENHVARTALEPKPLTESGSAALVRRYLPDAADALCLACHDATGGNPFLLTELLATWPAEGVGAGPDDASTIRRLSTQTISQSVLVRLGRLPAECASIARALAVLGANSTLHRAAVLANLDLRAAARAVDRMVDGNILAPGEPPRFIHPVVESSIAAELPAAEAAVAHLQVARLLVADRVPVQRVAPHLLRAPHGGETWVVRALRDAARVALSEGVPDLAARYLQRAFDEPPPEQDRREVLRELGGAEARTGAESAIDHLEEAAALATDPEERAGMLLDLGRVHFWTGQNLEAARTFDRGLAMLPVADSELAKDLDAAWAAAARLESSLNAEVGPRIDRIIERLSTGAGAVTPGERSLLAEVAFTRTTLGEHRDTIVPLALRALDDGRLLQDEGSESITLSVVNGVLLYNGELEASRRLMTAALDDARRRGSMVGFATCSYCRSNPALGLGRVLEAIADAQHALDAREEGWETWVPLACCALTMAHLAHNDVPSAVTAAALPEAEQSWGESVILATLIWARAHLATARGRPQEARDLFNRAGSMLLSFGVVGANAFPWRSDLALVCLKLGDRQSAERLADEELELARRCGVTRSIGVALLARGLVARGPAGIEMLEEARRVLAGSEAGLDHLRSLVELGGVLRRHGHRRDAMVPLREAFDVGTRWGALALARRAHDELLAAGARPRRAARFGIDALTPSEWRVARLAADGNLSNREIAEALFVTPKTVEFHLGNVYGKLEVRTRKELARRLADLGVPADEASGPL